MITKNMPIPIPIPAKVFRVDLSILFMAIRKLTNIIERENIKQ